MQIAAVQWSTLDHIHDVKPINDGDEACLTEIRHVLTKYGNLKRFGVALLHNHFDLKDDEVMMETTDLEERTHVVRPMTQAEIDENNIEVQSTIITFDETGYHRRCGCDPRATGHHHK